jgi:hypothetical protein
LPSSTCQVAPSVRKARNRISVVLSTSGIRNGNDLLDDELVWETIKVEVPVLLSEVEGLLLEWEEQDPDEGESVEQRICNVAWHKGWHDAAKRSMM